MKFLKWIVIIVVFGAMACTDANCSKVLAYGDTASIKCWSGGKLIFDGRSTGKVRSEETSDGYFFKDADNGLLREVSGNCVITYDDK